LTEEAQNTIEPDLIDRIANALPAEVRADYYRELTHCRSLPENDEMLRILRAIQFLALLMEQVPGRMVVEREKLESLFRGALEGLRASLSSVLKYHRQLDQRLAELPEDIADGISPDAIAGCINESLRQQFATSTLPETAKALAYVARNIKTTAAEFGRTASSVANAYRGSADAAGRAISELESSISRAAASARRAADDLTVTFHRTYRWALYTLAGFALFAGILFGMLLLGYLRP
jgi:hypothetical protein